jgi:hypothetical protein
MEHRTAFSAALIPDLAHAAQGPVEIAPLIARHDGLDTVIGKAQKLRALHRAKERVRQLERELRGDVSQAQELAVIPEFLRTPATGRVAILKGSDRGGRRDF